MKLTHLAVVALAFAGCERARTQPDRSTPEAAARCLLASVEARDLEVLRPCVVPGVPFEPGHKAAKAGWWDERKQIVAPLAGVTAKDFTYEPITSRGAGTPDQRASFKLEKDSLELVRIDGRWYIADTGI